MNPNKPKDDDEIHIKQLFSNSNLRCPFNKSPEPNFLHTYLANKISIVSKLWGGGGVGGVPFGDMFESAMFSKCLLL